MANTVSAKSGRARSAAVVTPSVMPVTNAAGIPVHGPTTSVGRIATIAADGTVMVVVAGSAATAAMVVTHLTPDSLIRAQHDGALVLVVPIDGETVRWALIGILRPTVTDIPPATATIDGSRVELTGRDEVILTCGKASITLTKAGKVMIKGTYVSSGADGVHRITGGSVQVN